MSPYLIAIKRPPLLIVYIVSYQAAIIQKSNPPPLLIPEQLICLLIKLVLILHKQSVTVANNLQAIFSS